MSMWAFQTKFDTRSGSPQDDSASYVFKNYGKRSVQTNKHTHVRAQCNHASVGLTQARPN